MRRKDAQKQFLQTSLIQYEQDFNLKIRSMIQRKIHTQDNHQNKNAFVTSEWTLTISHTHWTKTTLVWGERVTHLTEFFTWCNFHKVHTNNRSKPWCYNHGAVKHITILSNDIPQTAHPPHPHPHPIPLIKFLFSQKEYNSKLMLH